MISFMPFPVLETERLILRKINHNDVDDLFDMRNDPRMVEHTDSKPDQNINETRAYIDKMNTGVDDNKWIIWAIEHKQISKVIGTISIWNFNDECTSGEFGYGIIPEYQGQGFMKESLLRVTEFGFDKLNLIELYAYTEENNLASIKLLESCNFVEIDRVIDPGYFTKRDYHMIVYRLVNQKQ